jgi:SHS2 domain-containing protein
MVDLDTIRPAAPCAVQARGRGTEELLVRWLSELLYLRDTQDLLFSRFDLKIVEPAGPDGEASLTAVAWGETFDPSRHAAKTGIKAVTYHQVEARREREGWRARVIFDV